MTAGAGAAHPIGAAASFLASNRRAQRQPARCDVFSFAVRSAV